MKVVMNSNNSNVIQLLAPALTWTGLSVLAVYPADCCMLQQLHVSIPKRADLSKCPSCWQGTTKQSITHAVLHVLACQRWQQGSLHVSRKETDAEGASSMGNIYSSTVYRLPTVCGGVCETTVGLCMCVCRCLPVKVQARSRQAAPVTLTTALPSHQSEMLTVYMCVYRHLQPRMPKTKSQAALVTVTAALCSPWFMMPTMC